MNSDKRVFIYSTINVTTCNMISYLFKENKLFLLLQSSHSVYLLGSKEAQIPSQRTYRVQEWKYHGEYKYFEKLLEWPTQILMFVLIF